MILVAYTQLFKSLCLSVGQPMGPWVRPLVHPLVHLSVCPSVGCPSQFTFSVTSPAQRNATYAEKTQKSDLVSETPNALALSVCLSVCLENPLKFRRPVVNKYISKFRFPDR